MPKLLLPLVALLAIGGSAAGASVYLLTRDETVVEVLPSPVAEASPTATPTDGPSPTPTDEWTTYVDEELGFSFPHPPGLTVSEEVFDLLGKGDAPAAQMRVLTFRDASQVRAVDLGITPNPTGLAVQDWMDAYDPCASLSDPSLPQPEAIVIAGQAAIVCPIDQLMQRNPRVYFTHGRYVVTLVANVYGIPESGLPPALSEADFQLVIDGFRLGQ